MGPGADGTLGQALAFVMDDERRIEIELAAEPVAGRAGAVGVVEREQPGLDLGDRKARNRAGEFRRKDRLLAGIGVLGDGDAVGEIERRLERIGEPVAEIGRHHDAVDDDRDVVLQFLVERPDLVELDHPAVDLDPLKAALSEIDQFLAILALAPARDRRQEVEPGSSRHRRHPVDHLRDGLADDRQPGRRRIGDADPRPQEAHVVVDLGHRRDRRARVARGRLLLDRDRRRQPLDRIDLGLLHQFEELSGVGAEALDIAALALGVDRVEGQGRLAGTRQPGDHHEAVARQIDIDVLEVVLARAADPDQLLHAGIISAAPRPALPGASAAGRGSFPRHDADLELRRLPRHRERIFFRCVINRCATSPRRQSQLGAVRTPRPRSSVTPEPGARSRLRRAEEDFVNPALERTS